MDFIIIILTVLILFLILRTNYRLSEHEEKTRKVLDEDIKHFASINDELLQRITAIENKISFYQNQLNDLISENNSQNHQRNRRISKELEQIKSDTDIIKSLHLKRSIKRTDEKSNSNSSMLPDHEIMKEKKKKTTILTENKSDLNLKKKLPKESGGNEPQPILKSMEEKKITTEDESFKKIINEKIGSLTIDDVVILKQIFKKQHGVWFKGTEIEEDQTKIMFALPKLSRKLIVDGVPVVKIKTIRDKMMIMWGESLTESKVKIALKSIRGEM